MDFHQIIDAITPEVYENLKIAVETGRWPNGSSVSAEQRENCLQAVIAYDAKHKRAEERVGYIHNDKQTACGSGSKTSTAEEAQPLSFS